MNRPRIVPITVPMSVASGATMRMSRAPAITRANMSRPSWSVPNQCAPDGPLLIDSRFWANGLPANSVPKIAHTIQKRMIAAPTRNAGRRTSERRNSRRRSGAPCAAPRAAADSTGTDEMLICDPSHGHTRIRGIPGGAGRRPRTSVWQGDTFGPASLPGIRQLQLSVRSCPREGTLDPRDPDSRVEQRVEHVGEERDDHVRRADQQDARLQHRKVLVARRVVEQRADAVPAEQVLDEHEPADQVAGLARDHGA